MSTPEGKIKTLVKRRLAEEFGENVHIIMPPAGQYGRRGIPDILACVHGVFVGVECKANATRKPTKLQQRQLEGLQAAGGVAGYVWDADSIEEMLRYVRIHVACMQSGIEVVAARIEAEKQAAQPPAEPRIIVPD